MRKYLKTKEDIIKALKDGKKLYEKDYPQNHYEMIDGIICGQSGKNSPFIINCAMDMDDKFYIEEEKPLTIEVGKFYRTRDGRRAYCFYKEEGTLYTNHFVIDGESRYGIYTDDGLILSDGENPEDIIGYWDE